MWDNLKKMFGCRCHRFLVTPIVIVALLCAFAFIFSSSCKKNKECDAVITVIDGTTSAPIYGATVHMYPPPSKNPTLDIQEQSGTTDAAGTVTFTFKLPAILQADATPPSTYSLNTGGQLVKLEEGKQVSKTIKLY